MKIFLLIFLFAEITWVCPWEILILVYAASQLAATTGMLLLFFLRTLRLLRNTRIFLYYFFAGWQTWLYAMDIYLLVTGRSNSMLSVIIFLVTNHLLSMIAWMDIYKHSKPINQSK